MNKLFVAVVVIVVFVLVVLVLRFSNHHQDR